GVASRCFPAGGRQCRHRRGRIPPPTLPVLSSSTLPILRFLVIPKVNEVCFPLFGDEPAPLPGQSGWHYPCSWTKVVNIHDAPVRGTTARSEEHTSELQSRENLVCRLLLE